MSLYLVDIKSHVSPPIIQQRLLLSSYWELTLFHFIHLSYGQISTWTDIIEGLYGMFKRPKTNYISNVTPLKFVIQMNFLCGIIAKKSCSHMTWSHKYTLSNLLHFLKSVMQLLCVRLIVIHIWIYENISQNWGAVYLVTSGIVVTKGRFVNPNVDHVTWHKKWVTVSEL